ncbi:hypothetical protein DSUL_50112 [Desulfovibrionales bacterium]
MLVRTMHLSIPLGAISGQRVSGGTVLARERTPPHVTKRYLVSHIEKTVISNLLITVSILAIFLSGVDDIQIINSAVMAPER